MLDKNLNCVKMSLTRGQSAWGNTPSETQRRAFSNGAVPSNSASFNEWLVGIVDGDGTFYFNEAKKDVWNFSFQISQSTHNLRLLYFIKSSLKIGSVTIDNKNSQAVYRVRNREHIVKYVIPIFDAHPLLTSKHFRYTLFKEAIIISESSDLSRKEKSFLLSNLKSKMSNIPNNYVSPVWSKVSKLLKCKKDAEQVVTKNWLVGFVEAEGSFYLVKKSSTRLVHAFEITQKRDQIVMEAIALIFYSKVVKKKTHLTVVVTRQESIQFIKDYFFKTMKGMKSLEYRIWARSFTPSRRKRGFEYLLKIQNMMRKIRSIRFSKEHKNLRKN